jgi:hypothetical protein
VRLFRVSTRTIRPTELRGPDKAIEWITDEKDEPRVVLSQEDVPGEEPRAGLGLNGRGRA